MTRLGRSRRNVSAVVLDPTLVADRVVQLAPVYSGGPVLADNAVIPLEPQRGAGRARPAQPQPLPAHPGARPGRREQERRAVARAVAVGDANLHGQGAKANSTLQQPLATGADAQRQPRHAGLDRQQPGVVHLDAGGARRRDERLRERADKGVRRARPGAVRLRRGAAQPRHRARRGLDLHSSTTARRCPPMSRARDGVEHPGQGAHAARPHRRHRRRRDQQLPAHVHAVATDLQRPVQLQHDR